MNTKQLKSRAGGLLCGMLLACGSAQAATIQVTENITTDTTWTADNEYILTDIIYVTNDAALTIEPGTVIKGEPRSPDLFDPGTLVITRGAEIFAEGTREEPIIFTSTEDDGSLTPSDRGRWGGLIILGNAVLNTSSDTAFIEGLPLNDLGAYGGNANDDNSGVIRYVSIRHGGTNLSSNNEINGLTMGAVGSQTTIEYVEVFANLDDGFEWFGGTVNTRYLISAFCGDDSFDWDQGFRGKGQFWFTIQAPDANRAAEMDGGTDPKNGEPFATPLLYNITYIGSGVDSQNADNDAMFFDDFSGGFYNNSIFTDFGVSGVTFSDEDAANSSLTQLDSGNLVLQNNLWFGFGAGNTPAGIIPDNPTNAGFGASFARDTILAEANNNQVVNPELDGISREVGTKGLSPRPAVDGPAIGLPEGALPEDSFFIPVNYYGAFGPDSYWASGWTALSAYGIIEDRPAGGDTIRVDANITQNTTWTSDNTYVLTDIIYVTNGATLTIEPGTLIKGEPRSPNLFDPGTLVITRGSRILASGTAADPIVFTSTEDDGTLTPSDRGRWGGLIVLGSAVLNTESGTAFIEGLPLNDLGAYGGDDNLDNSGVIRYVSIRHGGTNLSSNNEINGLTMGALGSQTTIEYVEVFANLDDGFEWFGGTVNSKYLVSAFCGDDSFDWDQGFRGLGQFWFTIQAPDANRAAEMDGGTDPKNGQPFATPLLYNITYIGSGVDSQNADNDTMYFDDFSGGFYYNSIFTDFGVSGVTFSDEDAANSSLTQLDDGNLELASNVWFGYGAGNTPAGIIPDNPTSAGFAASFARDTILAAANNNVVEDPQLAGISREADSFGLNPTPAADGPATSITLEEYPLGGDFFDAVAYAGAFDPNGSLWVSGWTALDAYGILGADSPYLIEGAEDFGDGWYGTWLGTVNVNSWPWVYSAISWFYAGDAGNSNDNSWLFFINPQLNTWLYSSDSVYPWVYGQPTGQAEGWWFVLDQDGVTTFFSEDGSNVINIANEF